MLKGYKTYAVALVAIGYAIFGFFSAHLDANTAVEMILAALGAAGLRSAISNK